MKTYMTAYRGNNPALKGKKVRVAHLPPSPRGLENMNKLLAMAGKGKKKSPKKVTKATFDKMHGKKGFRHTPGNPTGVGYAGAGAMNRHTPGNPGKGSSEALASSNQGMRGPAGHPGSGGIFGGVDAPVKRTGRYPNVAQSLGEAFRDATSRHKNTGGSPNRKAYTDVTESV